MKIGIDLHGVCDLYPKEFAYLTRNLVTAGHEVIIITGQEWKKAQKQVKKLRISYTDHFSTVDYHLAKGTKMWRDSKKTWWMDNDLWIRAKGDFIQRTGIELHFDDTWEYSNYIPDNCTFVLVPKKGFEKFVQIMFMDAYGG